MKTPIALLIFNRPDTTARVFESIRQAKPERLLVIADGARLYKSGEAELCAETRAIIERVDWDCEVLTNYSDPLQKSRERICQFTSSIAIFSAAAQSLCHPRYSSRSLFPKF